MKRKKLINKLEGIGLIHNKEYSNIFEANINSKGCMYFLNRDEFCIFGSPCGEGGTELIRIENPTFKQILKAIKKHTGKDLKPSIEDKLDKLGFSPYSNLNYLSKTINGFGCYYFNYENNPKIFDINSNPVGDGGDLIFTIKDPTFKQIKAAIREHTNPIVVVANDLANKVEEPKEFIFGGYAEVLCSHTPFKIGSKVRTGFIDMDDTIICDNGNSFYWFNQKDLKPL